MSGLELPALVPESWFDFSLTHAAAVDDAIFRAREDALRHVPYGPPTPGQALPYAYFRGVGNLVVPTVFSPATTPRIVATALAARAALAASVQEELVSMALTMLGVRVLARILRAVAGVGAGRASPPPCRHRS